MPPQADFYAELLPNAANTFQALFRLCAQDSACDKDYPHLETVFLQTIDHLNAQPATFPIMHPVTQIEMNGQMNGLGFVGLLYRLLYDTSAIPRLPDLIYRVHDGDYSLLPELLKDPLNEPWRYSLGMNHTIHCSDEAPFTTPEKIATAATHVDPRYQGHYHWDVDPLAFMGLCSSWRSTEPRSIENQPVVSAIPTLILAGELDPASPPVHGRLVAQHLSRSFFFQLPGIGHLSVYSTPCAEKIAVAFLNDPATVADSSCIKEMTEPHFLKRSNPDQAPLSNSTANNH
jgi:hypothetical protein